MLFSIITCTYNSEAYLKYNLDNLSNQTYKNFEHIFIDGFSKDKTLNIINDYQKNQTAPVIIKQSKPMGISAAMNQGIDLAKGKYIIHLHSDDYLADKNVLQDVANFLEGHNYDWIYGKINTVNLNNEIVGTFPGNHMWHFSSRNPAQRYLLKLSNFIPHQAVFIKKEILLKFNKFDTRLSSAMDLDLWLKIRNKTSWSFFNRIISNYSIRPNSQSCNIKKLQENKNNTNIVRKRYLNKLDILLSFILEFNLKTLSMIIIYLKNL